MKDTFAKLAGLGALGGGLFAVWPLVVDVIEKGQAAFAVCAPAITPLYVAVVGLLAYLAKSPLQKK